MKARLAALISGCLGIAACFDAPELEGRLCSDEEPCPAALVCGRDRRCVQPCLSDQECQDEDACTLGEACRDGLCTRTTSITCNIAPGECYFAPGACDAADGSCVYTPKQTGAPCDDANACTDQDSCGGGDCRAGTPLDCDDNNACTDDGCDPAIGCVNTPNTIACDDGDACTTGDACSAEACKPGTRILCDDGNSCTLDGCDAALGCIANPVMDGTDCLFAGGGLGECASGNCVGCVLDTDCNDNNLCTTDQCVSNACVNNPNNLSCNDGNACTYSDMCTGGECRGTTIACNSDACTTRTCNGTASCSSTFHNGVTCADDGNACTRDICNPSGTCTHPYLGDGAQCGISAANRCCAGGCVNISSNPAHCGGCDSGCFAGMSCETISVTNTCSSAPPNVSGRCRCQGANSQCPRGQICRTVSPFTNRCTPDAPGDCAPGQAPVLLNSCPDYCAY